ncbi:MAG: T9SS type A sorting domain-containing protein [Chitinophagales bacterium]|jgi:hypothetical protein|nr:T9SS type A sorting domain-containing protein [Chitinophagales bacterium]MBP9795428.1 T9SS type A sorting domain-containing protein [Chitinophagales bacterium]
MKKLLLVITISFLGSCLHAQLNIAAIGSPETIDFTGFAGAGFQPGGGVGMLNSDTWSAIGFSDGDVAFGGTAVSGDFARGSTMGLVITGGVYAVDITGNQGLMVQPVDGDFTPGSFILKLQNNTGEAIGSFDLAYTIYVLNDAGRSNSFNLGYSYDNVTWYNVPDADYTSPEAGDFTPYMTNITTSISALSIADGALFYLSWTGNDVSGAGTRDEFALDDIVINAGPFVPLPTYTFDVTEVTVNEGDLEGSFDVSLSESADCTINFGYGAAATATPGFDYGLMGFTLDFTAGGPTTQTVIYGLVDDVTAEGTETGIILLASGVGCSAGADTVFTITIEDNELVTPPIASYTTIGATEDESVGTVTGTIELTESADCEIQMYLDGATTMTEGSDYIFGLPVNYTFTAGGATSQSFDISINDDVEIESTEMLLMNLTVISGTCVIGAIADFEININDNDATPPTYTVYDIAEVTTEDVDGNAVSDGELVDLTGIVYGVNLWDGGLQFTLIDNTGGISVFSFDNDFGYTVVEGDEVNILGAINQFNGLTEVDADTLIFIDGGNALKVPTFVTDLNETTESDLVELGLDGYYLADEAQWLGDGTSFNVEITNGTNTFIIRIDDNTELSTSTLLDINYLGMFSDLFQVKGIGSQFDTDAPYSSGYQLMPRYISDFEIFYESIAQLDPSQINIYPNPAINSITLSGKENILSLEIIDNMGRTIEIIEINNFEKTISVLDLPAGFYGLKIKTETGIYASGFIKQ